MSKKFYIIWRNENQLRDTIESRIVNLFVKQIGCDNYKHDDDVDIDNSSD